MEIKFKFNILLICGAKKYSSILNEELKSSVYELTATHEAEEVFSLFEKKDFDLIIVDAEMPIISGFEICQSIRDMELVKTTQTKTPLILLTEEETLENRRLGFEMGTIEFLSKSFSLGELKEIVDNILRPNHRWEDFSILLADPLKISLKSLKQMLSSAGVNVTTAETGKTVIDLITKDETSFDLLILNSDLKDMSGYSICNKLRNELGVHKMPILIMTKADDYSEQLKVFKSGASDTITRPIIKEAFLARVLTQLNLIRMYRNLSKKVRLLENQDIEKDRILASCSHDLRGPLGNIMGMAELTKLEGSLSETQNEYISRIESESERLINLTEEILMSNKLLHRELELTLLSLEEVINNSIDSFYSAASQKKISVNFIVSPFGYYEINGHMGSLERAINNVISNAIKFSNSNSKVDIHLSQLNDEIHLKIKDYGIGISKESIKHIFDEYSTVGREGTAGEKSTGLGMYIAEKIILKHNASILVESGEGSGSTFSLCFPVANGE
ncbi:MAG: signal transduction histidine kinase [Thermoproteota archaeon]|jgi:signal transduction histidine kinase